MLEYLLLWCTKRLVGLKGSHGAKAYSLTCAPQWIVVQAKDVITSLILHKHYPQHASSLSSPGDSKVISPPRQQVLLPPWAQHCGPELPVVCGELKVR